MLPVMRALPTLFGISGLGYWMELVIFFTQNWGERENEDQENH